MFCLGAASNAIKRFGAFFPWHVDTNVFYLFCSLKQLQIP